MTRTFNQLASVYLYTVYHECLSVVYLLVCTHVYLSVCSTQCLRRDVGDARELSTDLYGFSRESVVSQQFDGCWS